MRALSAEGAAVQPKRQATGETPGASASEPATGSAAAPAADAPADAGSVAAEPSPMGTLRDAAVAEGITDFEVEQIDQTQATTE
eukprot:14009581-Alexandrium_andersonii.AAC.1